MQTIGGTVRFKIFLLVLIILNLCLSCYLYRYSEVYENLTVKFFDDRKVEVGSNNYDARDMLAMSTGNVSIVKDVNINKVGEQVVVFQVKKENVVKQIPITIEVVDTTAPVIEVKDDIVYVNSGTYYDIFTNIISVTDNVDGKLEYKDFTKIKEDDTGYYTITSFVDTNKVGTSSVDIVAVDKTGNKTIRSFQVVVISHGKEQLLKNIAYSLLGRAYASGGNGPYSFDCSGFVQYVYARAGFKVSRSASTQLYDGYEVSYSDIQVGDILVWGYDRDHITHTAIYVGNGLMVHAANPSEGVVVNKVDNWGYYSGVHVVSVRRLS